MTQRTVAEVADAYSARCDEYIEVCGTVGSIAAADRAAVTDWAAGITGTVLDVGCGPGQWTSLLGSCGVRVIGIEPSAAFVAAARRDYPQIDVRSGAADALKWSDGAIGGVLAWYSLIHLAPEEVPIALAEFFRALVQGGGLLLGFFDGDTVEPFDHAVVTAYRWPVADLAAAVEAAGFEVCITERRTDPGVRPHGMIAARRPLA